MEIDRMPEVSVIIPVYNLEDYVEKTVRSVLSGSVKDFELLLVDDGSCDRTPEICRRLEKEDGRIRVLTKANGGAGSARNLGLENAEGRYIAFIDGDDLITENYLKRLSKYMKDTGADWVVCDYCEQYSENGRIVRTANAFPHFTGDRVFSGKECPEQAVRSVFRTPGDNNFHSNAMCLYRKDIIDKNRLRIKEDLHYGEDTLFNYEYAHYVDCFAYLAEPLYTYVQRSKSSKHSALVSDGIGTVTGFLEAADDLFRCYREGWSDEALWYAFRQIYFAIRCDAEKRGNRNERTDALADLGSRLESGKLTGVFSRIGSVKLDIKEKSLYEMMKNGRYGLLDTMWQTCCTLGIIQK